MYEKLRSKEMPKAKAIWAILYENGKGVPQDYAEALKWYHKAAEQGNAYSQNNVGRMYQDR